jgi:hypothetical protein
MQSRHHSLVETSLNTASGFCISWMTTLIVMPWFGFPVTGGQSLSITGIYTVISIIRSYFWRRFFNRLQKRN